MKKYISMVTAAVLMCALIVLANPDDPVQPQTLDGVELYRDVTSIAYSTNVHYTQGATLLMTNMVCYSTADLGTNSVIQGLDAVTVEVATSTSSTTTGSWTSATVQNITNGTWWVIVDAIPSASTIYWQCRITDSVTNVYYYQQQMLIADPHL